MNRYRVQWKRLKKQGYSSFQEVVMYDLDDIAHFIKHLEKDPKVTGAIDVVPCMSDS